MSEPLGAEGLQVEGRNLPENKVADQAADFYEVVGSLASVLPRKSGFSLNCLAHILPIAPPYIKLFSHEWKIRV